MNKKQLRQLIAMVKEYNELYDGDDDIGLCGIDNDSVQLNIMGFKQILDLRATNGEYGFTVKERKIGGESDLYTPYQLSLDIGGVEFFTIGSNSDFLEYDIYIDYDNLYSSNK
jgi:hypothetical protein